MITTIIIINIKGIIMNKSHDSELFIYPTIKGFRLLKIAQTTCFKRIYISTGLHQMILWGLKWLIDHMVLQTYGLTKMYLLLKLESNASSTLKHR